MVEPIELRPAKKAENLVWVCRACSCSTYYLHEDSVECAHCGLIGEMEGEWRRFVGLIPYIEYTPEATLNGTKSVVDFTTGEAALRHMIAKAEYATVEGIIIVYKDGEVSTWGTANCQTEEQFEWFRERVRRGVGILLDKPGK